MCSSDIFPRLNRHPLPPSRSLGKTRPLHRRLPHQPPPLHPRLPPGPPPRLVHHRQASGPRLLLRLLAPPRR
ncbi:hypothetical protein DID88_003194 [Monilinia fructigena]|uniref:Uncharacterized protein n=1 Tax=Monilinia fructigena TaxID=38457 RepID=A0A395IVF5_9HELO|nr:hypothetical protein DID88_003194 [Monilinia fructigena]